MSLPIDPTGLAEERWILLVVPPSGLSAGSWPRAAASSSHATAASVRWWPMVVCFLSLNVALKAHRARWPSSLSGFTWRAFSSHYHSYTPAAETQETAILTKSALWFHNLGAKSGAMLYMSRGLGIEFDTFCVWYQKCKFFATNVHAAENLIRS